MKRSKWIEVPLIGIILLQQVMGSAVANAETYRYRVREGDTLGGILDHLGICPIYGKNHHLQKFIEMNSSILADGGNRVIPHSLLRLPVEKMESDADLEVLASGEVVIVAKAPISKCPKSGSRIQQAVAPVFPPVSSPEVNRVPAEEASTPMVSEKSSKSGVLRITPTYEFTHLTLKDSAGKSASFLSENGYGLDLSWKHSFQNSSFSYFQGGFRHYSFSQPKSVATLNNASQTTWDFEAGVGKAWSEKFTGSVGLGYGQALSSSVTSATTLSLDVIRIPRVSVGATYQFCKNEDFETGLKGGASLLLPGTGQDYSTRLGDSENLFFFAGEPASHFNAGAGVKLQHFSTGFSSTQDTSLIFQVNFDLGPK